MLIEECMSRRVVTVKPLDSVQHARELIVQHRINQLPVILDGRVVGIITDRDVRDASPSVFDFTEYGKPAKGHRVVDPATITVESVMTSKVTTLGPKQTVFDAASTMRSQRIGSVPIVDGARLVGILTRSDVLGALVTIGRQAGPREV